MKIAFIVLIIVLAGVGVFIFLSSKKSSPSVRNPQNLNSTTKPTDVLNDLVLHDHSRYHIFEKNALEDHVNTRRVLYFYASWCPTCKGADKSFTEKASLIPEDVSVIRVNFNDPETDAEEKALARKYSITYQHTFVQIDSKGEQLAIWNGGQIEELLQNLK